MVKTSTASPMVTRDNATPIVTRISVDLNSPCTPVTQNLGLRQRTSTPGPWTPACSPGAGSPGTTRALAALGHMLVDCLREGGRKACQQKELEDEAWLCEQEVKQTADALQAQHSLAKLRSEVAGASASSSQAPRLMPRGSSPQEGVPATSSAKGGAERANSSSRATSSASRAKAVAVSRQQYICALRKRLQESEAEVQNLREYKAQLSKELDGIGLHPEAVLKRKNATLAHLKTMLFGGTEQGDGSTVVHETPGEAGMRTSSNIDDAPMEQALEASEQHKCNSVANDFIEKPSKKLANEPADQNGSSYLHLKRSTLVSTDGDQSNEADAQPFGEEKADLVIAKSVDLPVAKVVDETPGTEQPAGDVAPDANRIDEHPGVPKPAGETPAGDTPGCEIPPRETPARDKLAGETPARDTPAREATALEKLIEEKAAIGRSADKGAAVQLKRPRATTSPWPESGEKFQLAIEEKSLAAAGDKHSAAPGDKQVGSKSIDHVGAGLRRTKGSSSLSCISRGERPQAVGDGKSLVPARDKHTAAAVDKLSKDKQATTPGDKSHENSGASVQTSRIHGESLTPQANPPRRRTLPLNWSASPQGNPDRKRTESESPLVSLETPRNVGAGRPVCVTPGRLGAGSRTTGPRRAFQSAPGR